MRHLLAILVCGLSALGTANAALPPASTGSAPTRHAVAPAGFGAAQPAKKHQAAKKQESKKLAHKKQGAKKQALQKQAAKKHAAKKTTARSRKA